MFNVHVNNINIMFLLCSLVLPYLHTMNYYLFIFIIRRNKFVIGHIDHKLNFYEYIYASYIIVKYKVQLTFFQYHSIV